MAETPDLARIATLLADTARARMLLALMDGRALTATELALEAGVSPSTASSHLARLRGAELLALERQGRHRYFRLAARDVADAIESLHGIAVRTWGPRVRTGPRDPALRRARVCYDHLAGERGVQLFHSLCGRGVLEGGGDDWTLSAAGERFLARFGVDLPALRATRRPLCRVCLDWSERRSHLAGALGAALLEQVFCRGWARRERKGRVVVFTPQGAAAFGRAFPAAS